MSLGSEYLAEYAYEHEQAMKREEEMYNTALQRVMRRQWVTLDGRVLQFSEMETDHIWNCIRMLKRGNLPYRDVYITALEKELRERGQI